MSDSPNKQILVVEDDDDARQLLCIMLKSLNYEPVDFSSGAETLANLEEINPVIIMLDVMMPEMNGYELLADLKKQDKFKDLPTIMVTAKDHDDDVMEGYQHGADYYITKPYTLNQIQYAVELYTSES